MNLKQLLNQDRLIPHKTSKEEINNLLRLIKRDINDAKVDDLSYDRKFTIAYNAVLQSATILLYCRGYKPKGLGHHFTVFQAMGEIMGEEYNDLSDYFDSCRVKRNLTEYGYAGRISESEAKELFRESEKFLKVVLNWLERNYPEFLGERERK